MKTNKWWCQKNALTALLSGVFLLMTVWAITCINHPGDVNIKITADASEITAVQYTFWGYVLIAVKALLVLIASGTLVAALHKPFKKLRFRILGFIIIFLYGVVVYAMLYTQYSLPSNSEISLLAAITNTLSIFFPSRGAYDSIHTSELFNHFFVFNYYLVHLLAYIYGALLLISIIGGRMMNRAKKYFYIPLFGYANRYVFFGASEQSILLAKDIISTDCKAGIIFILSKLQKKDDELFEKLDDLGAVVYRNLDGSQIDQVTKSTTEKVNRYFFLDEDEDLNVQLALNLICQFKKIQSASILYLYIKSEIEDIDIIFNEAKKDTKIDINIFSQSDLTARQFITNYPMLDSPAVKVAGTNETINENNILLLGFGLTAHEILKKIVCDAQYSNRKLSITIIDKDFLKYHADFKYRFAEANEKYNIIFNPENAEYVGSPDFFGWLFTEKKVQQVGIPRPITNLESFNRIVIALGDDKLNISTAQIIANTRLTQGLTNNKEVIFTHIRNVEKYPYYKDFKNDTQISTFGNLESIYTVDIVINEEMDKIAKKINLYYALQYEPLSKEDESWSELSIFHQKSSRAAAMGISNILKINNYRLIKKMHTEEDPCQIKLIKADKIDYFSRLEHLRWNAFHRMEGISCWDYRTIDDSVCDSKYKINGKIIKHLCLVDDFNELVAVANKINQNLNKQGKTKEVNYQDSDRDNIIKITTFLNNSGYWIEVINNNKNESK